MDFLKQPEYIKHPYSAEWLKHLDVDRPNTGILSRNLPFLRHSVTVNHQKRSKGLRIAIKRARKDSSKGVQIHETYFVLGGPGTALRDPFAEGSGQSCVPKPQKKTQEVETGTSAASLNKDGKKRKCEDDGLEGSDDESLEAGDEEDDEKDDKDEEEEEPIQLPKGKARKSQKLRPKFVPIDEAGDEDDGEEPVERPKKKGRKKLKRMITGL